MWESIITIPWSPIVPCPKLGLSTYLPLPEFLRYYMPPVCLKAALSPPWKTPGFCFTEPLQGCLALICRPSPFVAFFSSFLTQFSPFH